MRITNLKWFVLFGAVIIASSGCSSNAALTPAVATRSATQTPWIINVPVTVTPEPATITPLPTAGLIVEVKTPTRTPTKAPVAAAKTATKPAPTTAPVAAVPTATSAPACSLGSVRLLVAPNDGAPRNTKLSGGGDAFIFQWTPFQDGETDAQVGYQIDIVSKAGSKVINGDTIVIQHNYFIQNAKTFIYDKSRVRNLANPNGDDSSVTWTVTVVKTTSSFDNVNGKPMGTIIKCGSPTGPFTINLHVVGE